MNATQFGEKYGRKYVRKIKEWSEKGYLGKTTQNEKTGEYSIPDDIPLPFSADSRVKKVTRLWKDILIAADNMNSMFSSMYPLIPKQTFENQIKYMIDQKIVTINHTNSGDGYLELLPNGKGTALLKQLEDKKAYSIFEKVYKIGMTSAELLEASIKVWPMISPYFQR